MKCENLRCPKCGADQEMNESEFLGQVRDFVKDEPDPLAVQACCSSCGKSYMCLNVVRTIRIERGLSVDMYRSAEDKE